MLNCMLIFPLIWIQIYSLETKGIVSTVRFFFRAFPFSIKVGNFNQLGKLVCICYSCFVWCFCFPRKCIARLLKLTTHMVVRREVSVSSVSKSIGLLSFWINLFFLFVCFEVFWQRVMSVMQPYWQNECWEICSNCWSLLIQYHLAAYMK